MLTDPIADMLTRIRNATRVYKESTDVPASRFKEESKILAQLRHENIVEVIDAEGSLERRAHTLLVQRHLELERFARRGERALRKVVQVVADIGVAPQRAAPDVLVRVDEEGAADPDHDRCRRRDDMGQQGGDAFRDHRAFEIGGGRW